MFFQQCTDALASKDDAVWEWQNRDQWQAYTPSDREVIEVSLLLLFVLR